MQGKNFLINTAGDLQIDLSSDLSSLYKELNKINLADDQSGFCKYFTPSEINSIKLNKDYATSYFHMNIASLSFHFDELHTLLNLLDIQFDFVAITESIIIKNIPFKINIELKSKIVSDWNQLKT